MVQITLDECPNEDILDYVSDAPSEEFDEIPMPKMNEEMPKILFFHGAPSVVPEKIDAMKAKIIHLVRMAIDDEKRQEFKFDIELPTKSDGTTYGNGWIHCPKDKIAARVNEYWSKGAPLGKNTVLITPCDDIAKILNTAEKFNPDDNLYDECFYNKANERDWMLDDKGREQILLRYQDETEVYWNDPDQRAPVLKYGGEREKAKKKVWCGGLVQWSNQGSFLCTFHGPGIAQWAGDTFEKKNRFAAASIREILFSPNEEYILTWNGATLADGEHADKAYKVFDVRTGELKKELKTPEAAPDPDKETGFPHFLWSPDSKYIARMSNKYVYVMDVAMNFKLLPAPNKLDKFYGKVKSDEKIKGEPISCDGITAFSWSPTENVIATWIPEDQAKDKPGKLEIREIPSRNILASKNFYSVGEVTMFWQSQGEYLALMYSKLSKSGKSASSAVVVFAMKKKNVPVETVQFKGEIKHFAWEPRGSRFSMLTHDGDGKDNMVQFFNMGKDGAEKVHDMTFPASCFNHISWAPLGNHFVLSAMGSGEMKFCSMGDQIATQFHSDEHFMLTDVVWDPSSRFVITAVTTPQTSGGGFRYNSETGYTIWSFQGRKLYTEQKEKLYQVAWRPHPPTLLPKKNVDDIVTNLKKYSRKYDQIDEAQKEEQRLIITDQRNACVKALEDIIDRVQVWKKRQYAATKFDESWARWKDQEHWEDSVDTIETVLDKSEELISG